MRIIAGIYRSRLLQAPAGLDTRPTSDRLRETLFNVLAPRIEGARFVDLYAGCGAVGLEAISRGAAHVWFAENAPPALAAIRKNLSTLKISSGYTLEDRSVTRLLSALAEMERAVDIIFLDPPYAAAQEYADTLNRLAREHSSLLLPNAVVIVEHQKKKSLAEGYGTLRRSRVLNQGDAALSFYTIHSPEPATEDSTG